MRFGEFIEYNMNIFFLEKSYAKWCGEASLSPFSKKSKLTIPPEQQPEHLKFAFIVCPS